MGKFDPPPSSEEELTQLFFECQEIAHQEKIEIVFDEKPREDLICVELRDMMDIPQILTFRDLDTREERVEYLEYIRFLDESCYIIISGYCEKLKRTINQFRWKKDDSDIDIDIWRKMKVTENSVKP